MDWTSLRCKSVLQTRSVLVQTHHSIHAKIIRDYREEDQAERKGRERNLSNTFIQYIWNLKNELFHCLHFSKLVNMNNFIFLKHIYRA